MQKHTTHTVHTTAVGQVWTLTCTCSEQLTIRARGRGRQTPRLVREVAIAHVTAHE